MLNSFPEELFEFIIKHLNDNNDIYNLRLVNKNFYKLLKVVPFYRNKIHIYDIKFKPNNIRWHKLNSVDYDKQIKFIKSRIRKNCSPKHVPTIIKKVDDIPRTKSGKIVELAVKKVINGEELNNKEAIANPASLEYFKNLGELK